MIRAFSDSEIVDLYLQRDEKAIAITEEQYGIRLRKIAFQLLDNYDDAKECENDTYLEAWNSIPPHEPRTYLFAYLGIIIRHIALDRCRRNKRKKRQAVFCELTNEMMECIPSSDTVDSALDEEELRKTIESFLRGCSREQRAIFVKRYWGFESITQISEEFGFSESKVKMILSRMRNRLQKELQNGGYYL